MLTALYTLACPYTVYDYRIILFRELQPEAHTIVFVPYQQVCVKIPVLFPGIQSSDMDAAVCQEAFCHVRIDGLAHS